MRSNTYYYLRGLQIRIATLPLLLLGYWWFGIAVLIGIGFLPIAGIGLALWYGLLFWHAFRNPSGPTGNCAGAFGDMAVLLGCPIGAVCSLVAAGIGALCRA